ncbi:MAG: hypothetical protein JXR95_08585 [Deltaproteobacteria bacterium]|nr:hypothetical protein [Deltaproteobacteria bacterium]
MIRKLLLLASVLSLSIFSGCHPTNNDDSCGYCDDSGCYGCDGDYCWPIENNSCNETETCAEDQICTDFGCASLCQFDADCNLGEECMDTGVCGPAEAPETKCSVDDDCGNGTICEMSEELGYLICVPGCQSDDECSEGYVCASCGRCVPEENPVCGDSKVFCESDEQCGTKVCSIDQKCAETCEGTDPLCPTGQICNDGVCIDDPSPEDPECVFSSQCGDDHVCINTYCHATCADDSECGFGEFCDLGVCKADYRPGE